MFGVSPVVPWGWTDRQTDITKLIVGFCNFAKASQNGYIRQKIVMQEQEGQRLL